MISLPNRLCCFFGLLIPVFGGFAEEPEQGNGELGDIITKKRAPAIPIPRRNSDSSPPDGPIFRFGDWNIAPYYMHTVTLGSDAGGNRDEYREQARGRTRARLGARLERRFGAWNLGAVLDIRGEIDAHRFNASERSYHQSLRTGNAHIFAVLGDPRRSSYDDDFEPTDFLTAGIASPRRFRFRAGRWSRSLTPEAFLFLSDAPGAELAGAFRVGKSTIRMGLTGIRTDREERRPYKKNGPSYFTAAMVGLSRADWELAFFGGFYRAPGRAAEPDLVLPGLPGTSVIVPTGQAARLDLDVHYYGLRYQQSLGDFDWRAGAYLNSGRSIAVDRGGIRQALTRKSIRGMLAHGSFRMVFGRNSYDSDVPDAGKPGHNVGTQTAGGCDLRSPASGTCITDRTMGGPWELELGVLGTTRDRDETDSKMRGFGSLRPGPVVMGGIASIILSGPAPKDERPALRNTQPGRPFSDGGSPRPEPGEIRDNGDPARPDFENQGLNMASIRLGHMSLSELRLDAFLNYGDFLRGDAFEVILALQWQVNRSLSFFGAATGASYRPGENEVDPLTGISARPGRRYYSRWLMGARLRF